MVLMVLFGPAMPAGYELSFRFLILPIKVHFRFLPNSNLVSIWKSNLGLSKIEIVIAYLWDPKTKYLDITS